MQNSHTKAVILLDFVSKCIQTLQNTEGVIINGQSRETGSIGYTSRRQTKQKHNTTCVGLHYKQTNTTNLRREQQEVKLNRTFNTEIVTDITIRNSDTQNDIKKTNKYKVATQTPPKNRVECHIRLFFLWDAFLPIRFNKLFKTCTRVYYLYKDLVYTNSSEDGDLI